MSPDAARFVKELEAAGWRVIVLWECEVKTHLHALADEIRGGGTARPQRTPHRKASGTTAEVKE